MESTKPAVADVLTVWLHDAITRRQMLGKISALAAGPALLAACGSAASQPPASSGTGGTFGIVAYQGADVLGGQQSTFTQVFQQGKPVILNFWAGLCPPCRAEMPGFQRVSTEFAGKVQFVGIDIGPFVGLGTHDDAKRLYTELGIRYPLAYAVDDSPLRIYNIIGMPTTVFFDAKGQVVDQVTGIVTEDQLRSTISAKLLGAG